MRDLAIITVPFINNDKHYNLAKSTYESIIGSLSFDQLSQVTKIAVTNKIRNGDRELIEKYNDKVIVNDKNNLARAWNRGIEHAIKEGCKYFYIPNLDIYLHNMGLNNLYDGMLKHKEAMIVSSSALPKLSNVIGAAGEPPEGSVPIKHHDASFSSFMISKEGFETIGKFDESFGVYHEDDDYLYRAQLLNITPLRLFSSVFYHYGQGTVKNDPTIHQEYMDTLNKGRDLYIMKWGGRPGHEVYSTPFNNVIT